MTNIGQALENDFLAYLEEMIPFTLLLMGGMMFR